MKKYMFYLAAAVVAFCPVEAMGRAVSARSVSSGVYEGGVFTPASGRFEAVYIIDEDGGEIKLEAVIENAREGRLEEGVSYELVSTMVSEGFSALTVSAGRKGQKIYTAVREGHLGAFEVLMVGEDFYEYSRAAGGRLYVESGDVTTISRGTDYPRR